MNKFGVSTRALQTIYDGEYFEIVSQQEEVVNVRCLLCGSDAPLLRASCKSSGNILKHISRKHLDLMDTIRLKKNIKTRIINNFAADNSSGIKRETSNEPLKILHKQRIGGNATNDSSSIVYEEADGFAYSSTPKPQSSSSVRSVPDRMQVIKMEARHIKEQHNEMTDDEILNMEEHIIEPSFGVDESIAEHESSRPPLNSSNQHRVIQDIDLNNVEMIDDPLEQFQFETSRSAAPRTDHPLYALKRRLIERQLEVLEEEHLLRMEVLRADLHHKRVEHQKKLQYLRMKNEK